MADDLLRTLRQYEEDYANQPPAVQKADLEIINELRARLGMRLVDAKLKELEAPKEIATSKKEEPSAPDHADARRIYEAYLQKIQELERHRAYAIEVVKATEGAGQTPVWPLAIMGTGGGPLLCDFCGKAIVLEGGPFHGVTADVAWKTRPDRAWTSWILGGMVVEITTNGTLRVYHGYPGHGEKHCCNAATKREERALAEFRSKKSRDIYDKLGAFLQIERPEMTTREREMLVNDIVNVMFGYDPGIGLNRP